jgi:hypothetical protein
MANLDVGRVELADDWLKIYESFPVDEKNEFYGLDVYSFRDLIP